GLGILDRKTGNTAMSARPKPAVRADPIGTVARSAERSTKVGVVLQKRLQLANQRLNERANAARARLASNAALSPLTAWQQAAAYWTDLAQRSILFWDTLRQRGNQYVEHVRAGSPPVLHFEYESVLDARTFERPANYALVRIVPPAGVKV